jgi:hypothetical protein
MSRRAQLSITEDAIGPTAESLVAGLCNNIGNVGCCGFAFRLAVIETVQFLMMIVCAETLAMKAARESQQRSMHLVYRGLLPSQ